MSKQVPASWTVLHRLSALSSRMPTTDDALHAYIKAVLGVHVPRVAVCPEHQAPFDFLADGFFRRYQRQLVLAARGSGKTYMAAIQNLLKGKFFPRTGTGHYAAVGAQANWGLGYLKDLLAPSYLQADLTESLAGRVRWKNGSWVRMGSGKTTTGITAYHPSRLVIDEVDLWDPAAYETAQYMLSGTKENPAELQVASTAYTAYGLMNPLLAQIKQRGMKAYRWCVTPDTLVWTERGYVRIDALQVGQRAWAWNGGPIGTIGAFELRPILNVQPTRSNTEIVEIEWTNGLTLRCTLDHEILMDDGWKRADKLTPGDLTLSALSQEQVAGVALAGRADVWDCTVEGLHNFVANGVVVHNCIFETMQPCPSCRGKKCPLHTWTNPRTGKRERLCRDRALRSDGFIPYEAVIDEFYRTDSESYLVQKLLEAPERRSLIYPNFRADLHAATMPPKSVLQHGAIGIGVDWGFDHPEVFSVFTQLPNGCYWGLEEIGERFLTPNREMEIALALNEQYKRVVAQRRDGSELYAYPTFFCGRDQPASIAAFAEVGLNVCPNQPRFREEGHKELRRLIDPNKGPLLQLDAQKMPMTVLQLGSIHRDDKGTEIQKDNDYADAARHVLATACLSGGLQIGGGMMR